MLQCLPKVTFIEENPLQKGPCIISEVIFCPNRLIFIFNEVISTFIIVFLKYFQINFIFPALILYNLL